MGNLLPAEITLDIFSRLTVETVLECKRVCKNWRTLLLDAFFADMHLRHQLLQLDDGFNYNHHSDDVAVAAAVAVGVAAPKVRFISLIENKRRSSSRKDDEKVEKIRPKEDYGKLLYYGEYDENDGQAEQFYKTLIRMNVPPLGFDYAFVVSCNGLICLSERTIYSWVEDSVYICNPITREWVKELIVPRFFRAISV